MVSPPYSSCRLFVYREMKVEMRYPTMPDSSIMSKPASKARRAAAAWSLTVWAIPGRSNFPGRLEVREALGNDGRHEAIIEVHATFPPAMEDL